jgi:ribosomal protein S18 acetylase RimI-like enzyme
MQLDIGEVVVRDREPRDDALLRALSKAAFGRWSLDPVDTVLRMSRDPAVVGLVADVDGVGGAFAFVRFVEARGPMGPFAAPRIAHLDAIAVRKVHRRAGLGSVLLSAACELAQARGALAMSLVTAVQNRPARSLFESGGFQSTHAVLGYYLGEHDALGMFRSLLPAP